MSSFIHLHTHSYYSFLEGVPSPVQLVHAALENGIPALALTDKGGLSGAIEFYEACVSADIQPILGLELNIAAPVGTPNPAKGHLVLLAMDLTGWRSLCRLSSILNTDANYGEEGTLPFEILTEHTQGLICLTGGRGSLLNQWLATHQEQEATHFLQLVKELFPERVYLEFQLPPAGPQSSGVKALHALLESLASRTQLPMVAAGNVYYMTPDQAGLQRLLSAIRLNCRLEDVPSSAFSPVGAHFMTPAEIEQNFIAAGYPQDALAVTQEIARRCRLEFPLGSYHYPKVPLPAGVTSEQALREKALAGAKRLYGEISPELKKRLDYEMAVITNSGFAPLFLIMEEIIAYTRHADIPYSSRGSAASSLVAHCLGITIPDPIRLDLYFERFLNPARSSPPDIDTDLCSRRRDEVIQHVFETYGADQVAMVGTINRFRQRSALREVAKAYGLSLAEVSNMADSLPHRWYGSPETVSQDVPPYAELAERYNTPLHHTIFRDAAAILEFPHHLSIHAGGVVISPGPVTDLVPVQSSGKGITITQLDLEAIERLGLVKLDLLGIRGLTVLGDVADSIRQTHALTGKGSSLSRLEILEDIPEEDADTAQLVRNGRTIGCFMIESPGMRATIKQIQADSIDDIMAALALYRPGPLTGGLKDAFVRRHLGQEAITHLHPALEPLLAATYGVILYQEQVLRIAHELAGMSLAEADLLRRAMSHFDPGKQMQTLEENFIEGAAQFSNIPPDTARRVWELIAAFAGYGFPKAHAASYALVAWRSAWCKVHYPAEFMAAVLACWGGYYSQQAYMMEARHLGLTLKPPHVNHSQREFSIQYQDGQKALFMGLDQVRELTQQTQNRILQHRPFHSLSDFLARVDPKPQEAENLVRVGAFEGLGKIPALLHYLKTGRWEMGQIPLFGMEDDVTEDWSLVEKAHAQETILGTSVDVHPLELVTDRLASAGVLTTVDAATHLGQRVRLAGMRQTWRRVITTHGTPLYFMTLEDMDGSIDVMIGSDIYKQYRTELSKRGPLIVEGVVELDLEKNEPVIQAERFWYVEG